MQLHNSQQVAERLDRPRSTIVRMAHRLKIGMNLGRSLAFTAADIAELKKNLRAPGNPKFVKGNKFGRGRPKVSKQNEK